jgi:PhoPQ-activated pathogenicity-related protein
MLRFLLATLAFLLIVPSVTLGRGPLKREPLTGPLAEYLAAPDDSFAWVKRTEGSVLGCKYVELTLTSQTWRGITWKHQLFVIKPPEINAEAKHALLLIGGGNWKPELADPAMQIKLPGEAQLLAVAALQMKTPVAILLHVPQQPIFDGKREDQIIAYTFREFLKTEDSTWPLLLPMVKSAVRGMDTAQAAAKKEWDVEIDTFTVTGASKRGWTTWLTGAADDRVTAIAPMVIDMLNMSPQIALQKESFGELSEEIDDYRGLDMAIDTPRGKALRQIVDPYEYRQRLELPKLIILGTNDRYWPLDAEKNYWKDLEGEKYLLRIPNNGHGLKDYGRIVASLNALHQRAISGQTLPKLTWKFADDSDDFVSLEVTSDVKPSRVRTWTATARTRDFRESNWQPADAAANGKGFASQLPRPDSGYAAFYSEVVFAEDQPEQFSLTTNVKIVPGKSEMAAGR